MTVVGVGDVQPCLRCRNQGASTRTARPARRKMTLQKAPAFNINCNHLMKTQFGLYMKHNKKIDTLWLNSIKHYRMYYTNVIIKLVHEN